MPKDMKIEGWKALIRKANNDSQSFERLSKLLAEQDMVTHLLRQKGYGIQGQSLLEMVWNLDDTRTPHETLQSIVEQARRKQYAGTTM